MKNLKNAIDYLSMNDSNGNYNEIVKEVEAGEITLESAKREVADILNRWLNENLAPSDIKDRQAMENLIESLMEGRENMKELKNEILKNGGHILAETANKFEYSMDLSVELTYLVEVDGDDFQTSQIANGFRSEPLANWLPIA